MTKYHVSKKARMFAATAFMLGVTTLASTTTYAASQSTVDERENVLVSALVQKFNLNSDEVKTLVRSVMEKQRADMEVKREQAFTDRINKAVTNKKITQEQATLLLAKAKEVRAFTQTLSTKTPEERKAAMKTQMDSVKQWLTDNNIPKDYNLFMGFGGEGRGKGMEKKTTN